jgi:hypothetical protein
VQRANLLRIAAIAAAFTLGGCYPALLTSRPEAQIVVTDEAGSPLAGVTVTLGTMERHGVVGRTTLEKFLTDRNGRVEFDQERDWAVQVSLPDGDIGYSWSLCFSKPGFEAVPMTFVKFDEPIRVALYPSEVPSECRWQEHDAGPRVLEREARWIEVVGGDWQTRGGFVRIMDEKIRCAMEASARQQGIKLRSWSEYRFQYQARGDGNRDIRLLVRAICRAPAGFDLSKSFYSERDDHACFFDTTYTSQSYTDQPKSAFSPLRLNPDGSGGPG